MPDDPHLSLIASICSDDETGGAPKTLVHKSPLPNRFLLTIAHCNHRYDKALGAYFSATMLHCSRDLLPPLPKSQLRARS
jgi:hypothetical protein